MTTSGDTSSSWQGFIPLQLTAPVRKAEAPDFSTISTVNLCSFIAEHQRYHGWRLYFGKETFKDNSEETRYNISEHIINVAFSNGCRLQRGGSGGTKGEDEWRICCCYYYKYQKARMKNKKPSFRPNNEASCSFRLTIRWETSHGWYIPIYSRMAPFHTCNKEGESHSSKTRAKTAKSNVSAEEEQGEKVDGASSNNTKKRKRSPKGPHDVLKPLYDEMIQIIELDPSKLAHFRKTMKQGLKEAKASTTTDSRKRSRTKK